MAAANAPKSILKRPSYPATTSSREDRDREVALYHANLLQHRRDIELEILLSTETLIDYPLATSAAFSASNPSAADAHQFKILLRPFQPSDYDALILERNINDRCGYTLCPNNKSTDGAAGKYRLIGKYGRAKDFKVVEKAEVEKWCSEACAKRALYVRVQLSESPAWERENYRADVALLNEAKSEEDVVIDGVGKMSLGDTRAEDKKQGAADLAFERGDKGLAAKRGLVDVTILEREVGGPVLPPSLDTAVLTDKLNIMHLAVDGHTTNFGTARYGLHQEDEEDTDWKL